MWKRGMPVLCLVMLLVLGACGEQKPENTGLLSEDEIAKCENLYFMDNDAVFRGLGISDEDIDRGSEDSSFFLENGAYPLKETRSIAGADFQVILTTSATEPQGLYGIWLRSTIDGKEKAREVLASVYDKAVERYGETDVLGGIQGSEFLDQIEDDPERGFEVWRINVGGISDFQLSCSILDKERYGIEIQYQVQSVKDGKRLKPGELLEMVRSFQQK